jgi:hypothetical protein
MTRPDVWARVRLFGMLLLLIPLFVGLHRLVAEEAPPISVQAVPQAAQEDRSIPPPAERIIYVLVPVGETPEAGVPGTSGPGATGPAGSGVRTGGPGESGPGSGGPGAAASPLPTSSALP